MPVRLILWDLGGVVFRFVPERRLRLLASNSSMSTGEIDAALWGSGLSEECDRGDLDAAGQVQLTRVRAHLDLSDDAIRDAWASAFEPDPEVVALLDQVADGVRLGSFSNNSELIHLGMQAAWPDLLARFDPSVWAYQARSLKPALEAYRYAERVAGVDAPEVCFVDDSEKNVAGAVEAGWDAVHFTDAEALRTALGERGLLAE